MNKITKNIAALIAFGIGTTTISFAQVTQQKIGDNPTIINPNAALQVDSSTKGLLLPRLGLTATNNFAPLLAHVAGMTVYNTATVGTGLTAVTPGYYYNDGTQWVRVATGGDAKTEPWRVYGGVVEANTNTQDIYQNAKVGIGNFSSLPLTQYTKQLEVKGDFKAERIFGANRTGFEVNTMYGAETTAAYWTTASNQTHAFVVDGGSARAIAVDNLLAQTKRSSFEVSLDAVNMYSKHGDEAKQATLQLNGADGRFALYANRYDLNWGAMVKAEDANGLLLYHAGSDGTGNVNNNDKTQVIIQKAAGVTFNHHNASGTLVGTYTFPKSNGTSGQVMTKTTGNDIIWANTSTFGAANNGLTKNATTGVFELGGTLNRTTTIATVNGATTHPLNITGLPTTGATTDAVIVSSTGGQLKTIASSALAIEPWNEMVTNVKATGNGQHIYQMGNVAIGATTIPNVMSGATVLSTPKFHVVGDVSITGKYYTTNSVYADYVFEKYFNGSSDINPNYEFKSLNYVKDFIKANNHLPGVESINDLAKAENGYTFDMTKLTVQSLEKIEELYLHTIEQQDKIDQQQTEIEKLNKDAEQTKQRLERLEKMFGNK